MSGKTLMQNTLAAHGARLDAAMLERLLVIAAQDGVVDAEERAVLEAQRWPAACRETLNAYLASADAGRVDNPEVALMRGRDPHFDARVVALTAHARPGDFIAWSSDQRGFPWNIMQDSYGQWMHVSLVLSDGLLLDPYWPEGVTVCTIEAAVAKSFNRIRANAFAVTRPHEPLSPEALAAVSDRARELLGKPYAFIAALERPCDRGSCTRVIWDLFREQGVDPAPEARRLLKTAVTPGDLVHRPVMAMDVHGRLELEPALVTVPATLLARVVYWLDAAMFGWLPLRDFLFSFEAPTTRLFMFGMDHFGRETRPGFALAPRFSAPEASAIGQP